MQNIIISTIKSWNIENALKLQQNLAENYTLTIIHKPDDLTIGEVKKINPRYIFFPHWSWMIPEEIYRNYECVVFHMTDLPYGRGGSPLQNLIIRKKYDTKLTALEASEETDGGRIYCKRKVNIKTGSAEDILKRLSTIIFTEMIPKILTENPTPVEQVGEVIKFKRRTPRESNVEILKELSTEDLYDFIRMLDGEGYPQAFIKIGNVKMRLSKAEYKDGKLTGKFEVSNE